MRNKMPTKHMQTSFMVWRVIVAFHLKSQSEKYNYATGCLVLIALFYLH